MRRQGAFARSPAFPAVESDLTPLSKILGKNPLPGVAERHTSGTLSDILRRRRETSLLSVGDAPPLSFEFFTHVARRFRKTKELGDFREIR